MIKNSEKGVHPSARQVQIISILSASGLTSTCLYVLPYLYGRFSFSCHTVLGYVAHIICFASAPGTYTRRRRICTKCMRGDPLSSSPVSRLSGPPKPLEEPKKCNVLILNSIPSTPTNQINPTSVQMKPSPSPSNRTHFFVHKLLEINVRAFSP